MRRGTAGFIHTTGFLGAEVGGPEAADPTGVTSSVMRLYVRLVGQPGRPPWTEAEEEAWRELGRGMISRLAAGDGHTYAGLGRDLRRDYWRVLNQPEPPPTPDEPHVWEALVRHWHWLTEEPPDDVPAAEETWEAWLARRREAVSARTQGEKP